MNLPYVCKRYRRIFVGNINLNMDIMKSMMNRLLLVCVAVAVVAVAYAGVANAISKPGRAKRPIVIDMQVDGGVLKMYESSEDGGSPVTAYVIESREKFTLRWKWQGISEELEGSFKIRDGACAQFRVRAVNAVGVGAASVPSDYITFMDL